MAISSGTVALFLVRLLSCCEHGLGVRLAPDSAEIKAACYFAYALRLDLPGSNHHTIRGADFQRKVWAFYSGLSSPAPLEEAFWILMLPEHFQETIAQECPAMLVLSYFLVAETKLYLEPSTAQEYAEIGASVFQRLDKRLASLLVESWPINHARQRLQDKAMAVGVAEAAIQSSLVGGGYMIDIVVAHCKETLEWLPKVLPLWAVEGGHIRVLIYEKCGQSWLEDSGTPLRDKSGSKIPAKSVNVIDDGPGGRKDECSAFLTHVLNSASSGDAAFYTFFLQADVFNHVQPQLLDLVMRAIRNKALDLRFLYLSRARMVASTSPCKRAIFEQVMGRSPAGMQVGYCCAHFVVRRDALLERGAEAWRNSLAAMDVLPSPACEHVRPAAGMHCLTFESMWHVMFGMPEQMSARAEDVTLPIFLRIPEVDRTNLPGGENSTLYFSQAGGQPEVSDFLLSLEADANDVTGARSIGYMEA
eukprot:TRINITY_DN24271_c0_g1_i2.p1 TRINITY_DN24271_c0_g1~~TRINITY_DN24271_c0_g1_i2.p1  ORF type:complete len:475 (+),score=58.01 TRINITY_DN24271_c0_g1_i2:74-1498(+)